MSDPLVKVLQAAQQPAEKGPEALRMGCFQRGEFFGQGVFQGLLFHDWGGAGESG